MVSFGGTSGDLGRSPSWTVEVDGSACQRAIAARQDGAQNRLSRVEEIATMQVCKYDAPRRRRQGRVTTERRKSVGAEREQRGEREGWRHGRWLGASPATQAYVVTDDTEFHHRHTPCICVGCEGPSIAALRSMRVVSFVKPTNLISLLYLSDQESRGEE